MGRRLADLAGQSAVYGLGAVVARFASLLLLPVYTHALTLEEFGRIELLVALVAVAATVAQLGHGQRALPLRRWSATGEERWAVVRTAIRFCFVTAAAATLVGVLATPLVADPLLGEGQETLWLVACFSLLVSLLNEALVGLYRVEARPWRFTAVTVVNVTVTVVVSVLAVTVFDAGRGGAPGRRGGRHRGRGGGRADRPPRAAARPRRPRAAGPDAALRPAAHALAAGALGPQLLEPAAAWSGWPRWPPRACSRPRCASPRPSRCS